MIELLRIISTLVDVLHEVLVDIARALGWNFTDKDMHFWVIGLIGIIIFLIADQVFKAVAKWHISIISFIYTSTVLLVIVFAIEIQQKVTGSGNMEFGDVTAGLWGFLWIFGGYLLVKGIIYLIKWLVNKRKETIFKKRK